jgi:outer membrane receptor protein involved in Fe transport
MWARGLRVSVGVNNVFDQRLRVTDPTGVTPISFQPDLLDPLGRSVSISIRKQFF